MSRRIKGVLKRQFPRKSNLVARNPLCNHVGGSRRPVWSRPRLICMQKKHRPCHREVGLRKSCWGRTGDVPEEAGTEAAVGWREAGMSGIRITVSAQALAL